MAKFQLNKRSRSVPESPLALFETLKRASDIRNPWWHQKEVMDSYLNLDNTSDVAIELPTGAGKTLVGLLLGEFARRRDEKRVVYLCPTRQLCSQVQAQANSYGISVVNLSGSKRDYPKEDLAAYLRAESIAVATYSALFNIKPGIEEPQMIICDDAHSAESFVLDMWKLRVERDNHKQEGLFQQIRTALLPYLSERLKVVLNSDVGSADHSFVEMLSPMMVHDALNEVEGIFQAANLPDDMIFPWIALNRQVRGLQICASWSEFEFRPYIAPTHSHRPFDGATSPLYLTATLRKN